MIKHTPSMIIWVALLSCGTASILEMHEGNLSTASFCWVVLSFVMFMVQYTFRVRG